ncbi:hypothetical protein GIB67_016849 [Kingdonia uniflora]|uniref:Folate-biopterin transporter 6 n=1 Tax=Kingdonia uniflora TaxID=39325 RepID=A0A7J7LQ37_9MAGN|nr:hypothetical protein GIB67_016849 [Kingdonia uniflora]
MDPSETQELVEIPPGIEKRHPVNSETQRRLNLVGVITEPFQWIQMLCKELNTSFVVGVMLVYGLSQGFSGSFFKVVSDYYWKDVQMVQPSAVQLYIGLYYIPWVMKPIWGILTDVFPVKGYRRRPYFIIAGVLGVVSALIVAIHGKLPIFLALVCLIGITAGVAIADVTIDACIARNSIEIPSLASDMQSLCGFCTSVGALIGYSTSGLFVHHLGPQGALGLLALPPALLVLLGFLIYELRTNQHSGKKKAAMEKVGGAIEGMYKTMKCSQVWKPSLYMYLSLALSISTNEGTFYWYTDPKAGPAFSQEFVGMIYAIGALASIAGVLIYHKILRNYQFRNLLFFVQLLYATSGMLDVIFILRWNLKLGIPDYFFVIMEECIARIVSRIRWMPMIVLSAKLCPLGIEGTFFALLMCIDSLGALSSKWSGGFILHVFHVTRTDFSNLWLVVLIRNVLRFSTLGLIFLIPRADQSDVLIPSALLSHGSSVNIEEERVELVFIKEKFDQT